VHRAFTAKDFRFYAPPGSARIVPYPSGDRPLRPDAVVRDLDTLIRAAPRFWMFLSRGTAREDAPLAAYCDGEAGDTYHLDPALSYVSSGVDLLACVRRGGNPPTRQ